MNIKSLFPSRLYYKSTELDSYLVLIFWASLVFVHIHNPDFFIHVKHQDGDSVKSKNSINGCSFFYFKNYHFRLNRLRLFVTQFFTCTFNPGKRKVFLSLLNSSPYVLHSLTICSVGGKPKCLSAPVFPNTY